MLSAISRSLHVTSSVFYMFCVRLWGLAQQVETSTQGALLCADCWLGRRDRCGQGLMPRLVDRSSKCAVEALSILSTFTLLCGFTSRCRPTARRPLISNHQCSAADSAVSRPPVESRVETETLVLTIPDASDTDIVSQQHSSTSPGVHRPIACLSNANAATIDSAAADVETHDYVFHTFVGFLLFGGLCLTRLLIASVSAGGYLLSAASPDFGSPGDATLGMVGLHTISDQLDFEEATLMRRLSCALFISFIGFWAGVGAGAHHPLRSALLAAI